MRHFCSFLCDAGQRGIRIHCGVQPTGDGRQSSGWLGPLRYFLPHFSLFPRLVFFFGFVLFFVGLARSVTMHSSILILGVVLIMFSLSCHYFSRSYFHDPSPPHERIWEGIQVLRGFIFLILAAVGMLWLLQISLGIAPILSRGR